MAARRSIVDSGARPFEWWMTSNLALGLVFNCFLPVLLPSYVLSAGGSPTDVWVAMAMAGLFALLGPAIGRFAGRRRAHRVAQSLGMLGMAGGLLGLALSPGDSVSIVLAIALMGIGAAAVTVAAPTFILGTDLPARFQSRQLTWLQLNLDLGKIVGGLLLGVMAAQQFSFRAQFWVGGLVMGLLAMLVWRASRYAAKRIRRPEVDLTTAGAQSERSDAVVPWRTLLLSLFGVPVVAQLMGSMTVVEAQISTMLALSGFVGIGLYFIVGRWMHRSGPSLVWAIGHTLRGVGGLALGVLGLLRGMPYLVVLAAFLMLESAPAVAWLAQARRARPGTVAQPAAAAQASLSSVPVGQRDRRVSQQAESVGVVVTASTSLAMSRPM